MLYVNFPIGKNAVCFNAYRIFDPREILEWSNGLFSLERFDYVGNHGD